jgi:hypothetical protein
MGKISDLNQIYPLDCPYVRQVRLEWTQHHWYIDIGYIRYWQGRRASRREHDLVAEAAFGMAIDRHYVVCHSDGDKLNNRATNLFVVTRSEFLRTNGSYLPGERVALVCPVCETVFEAKLSLLLRRNARYCSEKCRGIADRKVERPSALYLAELMRDIGNWTKIGLIYGVSDNAVRKWAKTYGLDLKVCDGRRLQKLDFKARAASGAGTLTNE